MLAVTDYECDTHKQAKKMTREQGRPRPGLSALRKTLRPKFATGLATTRACPALYPAASPPRTSNSTSVRTGMVWRGERQHYMRQNVNRPSDAFTVPVSVSDPGPDGRVGTADDGPAIPGYNLGPEFLRLAAVNIVRNVPDADSHYWTWDLTATRRFTGRWSLMAGFAHTWSRDQASGYFGQSVRNNVYPLTPNDPTNAGKDGRYEFRIWSAKIHGTYVGPWEVRITPVSPSSVGAALRSHVSTRLELRQERPDSGRADRHAPHG